MQSSSGTIVGTVIPEAEWTAFVGVCPAGTSSGVQVFSLVIPWLSWFRAHFEETFASEHALGDDCVGSSGGPPLNSATLASRGVVCRYPQDHVATSSRTEAVALSLETIRRAGRHREAGSCVNDPRQRCSLEAIACLTCALLQA